MSIRYAHATTTHKAQGKEFTNVLVDDSDIRRIDRSKQDGLPYKKAIYTAITRARHTAVAITDANRFDANSPTWVTQNEQNELPGSLTETFCY